MRRAWHHAALSGIGIALASVPAAADEVRLLNGDRLTGEVVAKSGAALTLRTRYAGEIAIRWSEIASVVTDSPVEVLLEGAQAPIRARLQAIPGEQNSVQLLPEEGPARRVPLSELSYLNPKPYETGRGIGYSGRATLSAAYTRGNAQSERLYGDAELTARAKHYRYEFSAKAERQTEAAADVNTAWLLGSNYDRFLQKSRFAYVRGSIEHDRARDVERRTTLGLGYGWQVLDTPGAQLTLRGGLDYVALERVTGTRERYPALGWGIKARYQPWGPRVRLFHEQEGFWNLEDTDNVIVRSKTGLRVPLVARFNASAQVNVDWERSPAPGRVSTDRTLLLGVDYTF